MVIYDSIIDGCFELTSTRDRKEFLYAAVAYLRGGAVQPPGWSPPGLKGNALAAFTFVKPSVDKSLKRAEAGRAGGSRKAGKLANDLANGVANGVANEVANGVANDLANGVAIEQGTKSRCAGESTSAATSLQPEGGGDGGETAGGDGFRTFLRRVLEVWNEVTGQGLLAFSEDVAFELRKVHDSGRDAEDVAGTLRVLLPTWERRFVTPPAVFGLGRYEQWRAKAATLAAGGGAVVGGAAGGGGGWLPDGS